MKQMLKFLQTGLSGLNSVAAFPVIALGLALIFLASGCDCEYSPYDTRIDDSRAGLIARSMERVDDLSPASPDSFVFAFLTDTHARYDDFRDAILSINKRGEVLFVIHGGDITDRGLAKEYSWASDIIEQCVTPFFPVIGNHDCLSNGKQIFEKLFGATYYTFEVELRDDREIRFVILNDNTLEYDLQHPQSSLFTAWLESAFEPEDDCLGIVTVAHVPPFDPDYFDRESERYCRSLLAESGVTLSLHGHVHRYSYSEYYGDGVQYLVGDDIRDRIYYLITVYTKDRMTVHVTPCPY